MKRLDLSAKEQMEIRAWRDSPTENPHSDSPENLVNKLGDAAVFLESLDRHRALFEHAKEILEIGAGQGWAACIVRKKFDTARFVLSTDISPDAVAGGGQWERVFSTRLDGRIAMRSYEIPLADRSIDLIFAFAAAHHFAAHRRTIREIHRVLRPGGHCLYLHEPTCRQFIYPLAHSRVNGKGMPVPEDVLIYAEFERLARETGLIISSQFDLSLTKRGPIETLYYGTLRRVGPLKHVLPCTRDILFMKPGPGPTGA